jgi:hypothetical protein
VRTSPSIVPEPDDRDIYVLDEFGGRYGPYLKRRCPWQYPNSISGVERSAGVPANVISKDCRVPENKPIIIVI